VAETKHQKHKDEYVTAALEFVDEHGLPALTMRALGEKMGLDPTAAYRHFPKKEDLIDAMLNSILGDALARLSENVKSPREDMYATVMAVRTEFEAHPNLTPSFATSMGNIPNGLLLSKAMIKRLQAMNLQGDILVRCYQMMEGYIMGASVFDTGGAPETFLIRQARYRYFNNPDFDNVARTTEEVQRITNESFAAGINVLLNYCETLATK
jgi:TetR/AcrR family transcriptional regulator, tetracycline repressor protein